VCTAILMNLPRISATALSVRDTREQAVSACASLTSPQKSSRLMLPRGRYETTPRRANNFLRTKCFVIGKESVPKVILSGRFQSHCFKVCLNSEGYIAISMSDDPDTHFRRASHMASPLIGIPHRGSSRTLCLNIAGHENVLEVRILPSVS